MDSRQRDRSGFLIEHARASESVRSGVQEGHVEFVSASLEYSQIRNLIFFHLEFITGFICMFIYNDPESVTQVLPESVTLGP